MKIGNIETKSLSIEKLRKCVCKTTSYLIPSEGSYAVRCPRCETMTAFYETEQDAFNAWENKILL